MNEPNIEKIRGMSAGQFVAGVTNFYHLQEQRLNEEFDKHFFSEREGGPMRFESTPREGPNPFYARIAEAQQRYDMAKPGDAIPIDHDVLPYINRTDKNVVTFSDEVTDFGPPEE